MPRRLWCRCCRLGPGNPMESIRLFRIELSKRGITGEGVGRPEELINHLVILMTATGNITRGLGTLALLWSTVVLLGGFVSVLPVKEFSVLTLLSIVMACRVVDNFDNEFKRGIYMQEEQVIHVIGRQKWIVVPRRHKIWLRIAYLLKFILLLCLSGVALNVTPYLSLGISVWRLVHRDYGDAAGDAANRTKLAAALDIFYALVLFQSLFVIYWSNLYAILHFSVLQVAKVTKKEFGHEDWSPVAVVMYSLETRRKFNKDGELPSNWNLITYAVGLLESASGDDDHLWGARLLDKPLDNKDIISVRQEMLSSRSSIQNLISMIGRNGKAGNIENRERAARILALVAADLYLTDFPGTLQCICSLLESNQFCGPQVITCPSSDKNPDEQSRSQLETSIHQHDAHISVPIIQDKTDDEQVDSIQQIRKDIKKWRGFTYRSRGAKELIFQGLVILEGLTQDKVNCKKISRHQLLLYKITSPISSHDFLSSVWDGDTMVEMLGKSLTVIRRVLTCPGDGATRLRQELASTTEAVSNLMVILKTHSGAAQELHGKALEILTELAFDDSFNKLDFNKLFKTLLCIFLEEAPSNNTVVQVEQADRENATRLMRGKAGEALARLLPISTARDVTVSKQEAINLVTKVLDQILSSKMGTNVGAAENFVESQRQEEADCIQPHTQGDETQSEERKFMTAMLSLVVVICNENVISREDFAQSSPEDAALAKKLYEILKVNRQCTAECLRVLKLTCQVVIAMILAKPSSVLDFNEHKEALTEALGTMSEVDNCMLFAKNDREVVKPARSLASLVKEAQKFLKTAQEQDN